MTLRLGLLSTARINDAHPRSEADDQDDVRMRDLHAAAG